MLNEGVLFTSSKRCFTLTYLRFFADLHFRGYLSSAAVAWAYQRSFADDAAIGTHVPVRLDRSHMEAHMYYLALREFGPLGEQGSIRIGAEVSRRMLHKYEQHLNASVFPDPDPASVLAVVGDGHAKVLTKRPGKTKRSGKPRTKKAVLKRNYTNGWFMVCAPTGRVLVCQSQVNPENNEDTRRAFARALEYHPKINCIVYDRNCSFAPTAQYRAEFSRIRYWPVDSFHGNARRAACTHTPQNNPSYRRRLRRANTSVCEQTFSCFRGYARTMNEMKAIRQHFLVLLYVRMHNDLIANGDDSHLGNLKRPRRGGHYGCH